MKSIRLLQLGDIHYPDSRKDSGIDAQDDLFPTGLQELTQLNPLQAVMRRVGQTQSDFILICGDVTTRGDVGQYDDCLTYLFQNLDLGTRGENAIHAVPGNHDVERSKVDQNGADLYGKFDSFAKLWDQRGMPILTVKAPRTTTVSSIPASVTVTSLNSSLGCGENYYPKPIRTVMEQALQKHESETSPEDGFALSGQTLDTPLVSAADIAATCDEIEQMSQTTVPVVLAHHNFLPQAIPRIAIYTELINGGLMRSRLSSLKKTVIYCHGHIHQNPVEIIQDSRDEKGKLISIAAPELARGFNLITIEFSDKGVPLGCVVQCHRYNQANAAIDKETLRIPLQSATSRWKHSPAKLKDVLSRIPTGGVRFPILTKALEKDQIKFAKPALLKLLKQAEWLGFISIDERDDEPQFWQIRSYAS